VAERVYCAVRTEYVKFSLIVVFKQDRKYTYNVTLRRVHATIVGVEKQ